MMVEMKEEIVRFLRRLIDSKYTDDRLYIRGVGVVGHSLRWVLAYRQGGNIIVSFLRSDDDSPLRRSEDERYILTSSDYDKLSFLYEVAEKMMDYVGNKGEISLIVSCSLRGLPDGEKRLKLNANS